MSATPPGPGAIKVILETLLKSFALIFNPIAERIGNRLRRKPKLHIYVRPMTSFWGYAGVGEQRMMQAMFSADITNDDAEEYIFIIDGYIKGTKPKIPFVERIKVPPTTTIMGENIAVYVTPVLGEHGKGFTGKVILIDQWKRKHPTDKITFMWTGAPEPPKPPTHP